SLIAEDRPMDDFPGNIVYVKKKSGTNLQDVAIYALDAEGKMTNCIHAARATVVSDPANNRVFLRLYEVHQYDLVNWSGVGYAEVIPQTLTNRPLAQPSFNVPLSDMTFPQLCRKLRDLEQITGQGRPVARLSSDQLREQKRQLEAIKADLTMPVRVQIHRQVA